MFPVVPAAAPPTPSTVGFGDVVLMLTAVPAMGTVPLAQLVPTFQSLLVVPVQATWAAAGPHSAARAAAAQMILARICLLLAFRTRAASPPMPAIIGKNSFLNICNVLKGYVDSIRRQNR